MIDKLTNKKGKTIPPDIYPRNWITWKIFSMTKWDSYPMGGIKCLSHSSLKLSLKLAQIKYITPLDSEYPVSDIMRNLTKDEQSDVFMRIQYIEIAALKELNKNGK